MPVNACQRARVSEGEARAELERLLSSNIFSRSERSQSFLRYVCDLTLKGDSSSINQHLIAYEVFGRSGDYSGQEDSLVRRQAHEVRRRLDAYYANEGRDDPVRIELPLGHYVPAFHRQSRALPDISSQGPSPQPQNVGANYRRLGATALAGLALVLVGWVLGRTTGVGAQAEVHSAVRELWGGWLSDPAGALICFSNPMSAIIHYHSQPLTPGPVPYRWPATTEEDNGFRALFDVPPGGHLYLTPSRVNTKAGEAIAGVRLASLFGSVGISVRGTESRLLDWDELRGQNVILLGHNEANPWIDPLLSKYPLRFGDKDGRKLRFILNSAPRKGEQPEYIVEYPENRTAATREYALVSMIPGLAEGKRLLLINGLNTQATRAATEFLTKPNRAEKLASLLRKTAPDHKGPWRFQMVVQTEVRDKVPLQAQVVALRVF